MASLNTAAEILNPGRTLVVGVLNVTPDSFSDGGKWVKPEAAIEHGLQMVADGADIIDVGGESTRPGSDPVDPEEEMERILPVVDGLVEEGVALSIDTMHPETAEECAFSGARIINDVSGGLVEPDMLPTIARLQHSEEELVYICQHWRGNPATMNKLAVYRDTIREVWQEIDDRLSCLEAYGADMERVTIDPGLGFSKNAAHNWQILAGLDFFLEKPYRMMVGVSRKRFLAPFEVDAPVDFPDAHPRDLATAALSAFLAQKQVWTVRVHNVAMTARAIADPEWALSTPVGKRILELCADPSTLTPEESC